ncbi:NADH-quinone oxidoreductase subunit NuoE family protein [Lactonifactor longoviformis]|uniref:NADH-quinone oxidoreductase subunit NuoE family protein n=1 Tax=Lactonifactor longoviformis TaxID=341220 RepID=UPI001D0155D5|nr:NAD(P)H-dependent oxidoreductase subunit E [Lactonifactor longoviformis]MCB5714041.1 NAD(P)H-dependent oxidoreductase subunit E [Lactonifactor longoviformis]MCB5718064.1 NAD(P)H-dependent oxidoreductase subunit E [Lactonifactor longoviformis]
MKEIKHETEQQLDEILKYYSSLENRGEQNTIKEMLWELQEAYGSIPVWLSERAAKAAGVKLSFIRVLLRLSPSLKEIPYSHEILICTGERCHRKGGKELLAILKKELQIGKNGVSKDGSIYLRTQNCLKRCRTAPNAVIDGMWYYGRSPEEILEVVKNL